jgi:2-keto-4-pentenoate hydratase/2-oxohepta-3-ene-1,7-dioic acid hydratase in catechol pathway
MFSPKGMDLDRGWPGRLDGDRVIQLAAQTLQVWFTAGGALREHAEYALADVELRAPVLHPPGIRLFDGDDFVFGNTAAVFGPESEVPYPEGAAELRTGPAVAAVIGADGAIGGFTGANAWTAPGLPGAKAYDFALSVGPLLVTADQYDGDGGWAGRVAAAARNTVLRPGELLVVRSGPGASVVRGEVVEVDLDGVGLLRNRVAS